MPAASIGQQKGPNSSPQQCPTTSHTTNASKVEQIGLQSFVSSTISPDLWPVNYHFFKHLNNFFFFFQQLFTGKMLLQPAESRKCFSRVRQIPKHRFLQYRSKPTYLIGKNVLIVMVSILINKDVIEPSYNDLKFTVQKHNCFFINLV